MSNIEHYEKLVSFAEVYESDEKFAKKVGFEFDECKLCLLKNGLLCLYTSWAGSSSVEGFKYPELIGTCYGCYTKYRDFRFSKLWVRKTKDSPERKLRRPLYIEIGICYKDGIESDELIEYECLYHENLKYGVAMYFGRSEDLEEVKELVGRNIEDVSTAV